MGYRFDTPLSLAQFREFAREGDVNAARHLTRSQLELTVAELLSHYDELPAHSQCTLDGALACAMQAAARGETFE